MTAIIVTGSRDFDSYEIVMRTLGIAIKDLKDAGAKEVTIRHGAARGADALAVEFINKEERTFKNYGVNVQLKAYPPNFDEHGSPGAYHVRNRAMISDGADLCLAFFKRGAANRGTSNVVRDARKAGIEVREAWSG